MDADIVQTRQQCSVCDGMAPSQPAEELLEQRTPDFPFQICVSDFFTLHGHDYLLYVDKLTGWVDVYQMGSTKLITQNIVETKPLHWEKTGKIVEVHGNRQ